MNYNRATGEPIDACPPPAYRGPEPERKPTITHPLDEYFALSVDEIQGYLLTILRSERNSRATEGFMHIVSASRRTDIPAFHAEWFMARVHEGTVTVRHPFGGAIFDVSLRPDDVIAIVFWTKNATPMLAHLDVLLEMGYSFTFLYTINNYPLFLEPRVPELSRTLRIVEKMSKRLPDTFCRWRYDTIVLTDLLDRQWHLNNFRSLCRCLVPYTRECIFSFCDYYKKTIRNMVRRVPDYQIPEEARCKEMGEEMAEIAGQYGISLSSCAHDFLVSDSIGKARCVDPEFLSMAVDTIERKEALKHLKTSPTRKGCGCAASKDIGAYDTCAHGCVYCYANADPELARKNLSLMRVESPCLYPR
jgi:hypothetical protein